MTLRKLEEHLLAHALWEAIKEVVKEVGLPILGGLSLTLNHLGVPSKSYLIGGVFALILTVALGSPLIRTNLLNAIPGADRIAQIKYRNTYWIYWWATLIVLTVSIGRLHAHYADRLVFQ
jgi:hypothetical protein